MQIIKKIIKNKQIIIFNTNNKKKNNHNPKQIIDNQ